MTARALAFLMLSTALTVSSAACPALDVPLPTTWRFAIGDQPGAASPAFDDSTWRTIESGRAWEDQGYADYDGVAWYRTRFDLPAVTPDDLVLDLGKIDDADTVYINGELAGAGSGWMVERHYLIPQQILAFGAPNLIAVRVQDEGGGGGLVAGPWRLRTATAEERQRLAYADPRFRVPVISPEERLALPSTRPFKLTWRRVGALRVPLMDGEGLWGGPSYSGQPLPQSAYDARLLPEIGFNNLRMGVRPIGYALADWVREMRIWDRAGVATFWAAYAVDYPFVEGVLGLPEGTLNERDRPIGFDGRPEYFHGAGSLGNIWNPECVANYMRMYDAMLDAFAPFRSIIGWQITNEVYLVNGSYDSWGRRAWREFLASYFGDTSPAADSNHDGATFNRAYGTAYRSWRQVPLFTPDELRDPQRRLLTDYWLGSSYAGFLNEMARHILRRRPGDLANASICVPLSPGVDLSLCCSMPDVNAAFINTYGCWLGSGLLMAAIANTYGVPAITSEINYPSGDYEQVKWTLLTLLPYYSGFQWFGYNIQDGSEPLTEEFTTEYGGKYSLIEHGKTIEFNGDGDPSLAGPVAVTTNYDERFALIPQLAPFVGRLDPGIDDRVLWICADGYRPDYREDHEESQLFRAHVTSDLAVALNPRALDLGRYRVVIYRNVESPCPSRAIYRKLRDYVRAGGTVVTGAYHIGRGPTLLGEDNRLDWWPGLRLADDITSGDGDTIAALDGVAATVAGRFPYLISDDPGIIAHGEVTCGDQRYPLVFVRREGKGRWVLVNLAPMFRMGEPFGEWDAARHAARFRLLRAIVEKYAGVRLPYRYEPQTYQGIDCALAIWQPPPEGAPAATGGGEVTVATAHPRVVAFEAFERRSYGGPCLEARAGRVEIPAEMSPGQAKLWVVKPYGRPVVLMTDGTLRHRARLDDGRFDGRALTFRFAERAYVSSPLRPTRVLVDGQPAPFAYDEATGLLTIERTGMAAEALIEY